MDLSLLSEEARALVSRSVLFAGVPWETAAAVLEDGRCQRRCFGKGEIVFDTQLFQRSVGLLLSGEITVSNGQTGARRWRMHLLGPGSLFGAAAVFGEAAQYVTRLRATAPCCILFFPQDLLEDAMRREFRVAENYICFLSGRIRFLNRKIQSLLGVSANQTLARYLLASLRETPEGPEVRLEGSVSALAETLNLGRASLYRALHALEEDGLVSRRGKVLLILDREGLSHI